MKKFIAILFIIGFVSFSIPAQGFYLDAGLGLGKAWSKIEGVEVIDHLKPYDGNIFDFAIDFDSKAGYGPFGKIPLYAVGEFGIAWHETNDGFFSISHYVFFIGTGVIFYPISLIQLGFSLGLPLFGYRIDTPGYTDQENRGGFVSNISAAVDFGKRKAGCLVGIKYFLAVDTLNLSNIDERISMVSIFGKFTFRKKVPKL